MLRVPSNRGLCNFSSHLCMVGSINDHSAAKPVDVKYAGCAGPIATMHDSLLKMHRTIHAHYAPFYCSFGSSACRWHYSVGSYPRLPAPVQQQRCLMVSM